MTRWQLSSNTHFVLTLVAVVATTCSCATSAMACPEVCQCTQTYYAYCQSLGLTSDTLLQVVMAVPSEAVLLDLSSNTLDQLSTGVVDSVPNLEYLLLAHNQLHSLGQSVFRYLQHLKELSLNDNRMTGLSAGVFVNMSSLRKLHMDSNQIQTIEVHTFSLPSLQQLFLQKNLLTSLGSRQLHGLPALQSLDMSDNSIHTLEVGVFTDLPSLQVLRLSRNHLSSLAENVFQGLTSLQELYLDGNMLPSLDCLQLSNFASALQRLVLSNNSLQAVPSDVFPRLRSLRVLALDHNRISHVGWQAFSALELDSITLAHNQLEEINRDMLAATRRISSLDLSHNRVHTLKTGALDSFRESVYVLSLADNRLATLDHGMFRGMHNLQTLNLSSNRLTSILDGSFRELTQLTHLDLNHNQLQRLSADHLQGLPIEHLSVLDNPLQSLSGFTFEGVEHPVSVFVNLTVQSSTQTSITVTWPYRQGAQLYWTLRLWCVSGSAHQSTCSAPLVESSLPPNKLTETVVSLLPGTEYFVCVNPTFLATDVKVSQCGRVSTNMYPQTTVRPEEPKGRTANSGMVAAADWPVLWLAILLVLGTVHHDWWWDTSVLISWTKDPALALLDSPAVPV